MNDATVHKGSCLCGTVEYAVQGDFQQFFLCHCSHCQKGTGSAHGANLFSSQAHLEWLAGQEAVETYRLPDTRHVRSFCRTCGCPVPTELTELGLVIVPAGSLDGPVTIKPNAHLFTASKANWEQELDSLPRFDRLPE